MGSLPKTVVTTCGTVQQRSIDDLNAKLLRDHRVILGCATYCHAMRGMGMEAAAEAVAAQARPLLANAQAAVTRIQSLGGAPAYQIKDFGILIKSSAATPRQNRGEECV